MPDITMCEGGSCKKKSTCYRFTATPNPYRQSYFMNPPFDKETDSCQNYVFDDRTEEEKQRAKDFWKKGTVTDD